MRAIRIQQRFQTATSRGADRRLVIAGLPAARIVLARILSGLSLAALASTTALVALALRTGIAHPVRVIGGTLMFSVIYVAVGAAVDALVHNPINGTVIVLFVWILDVFFGPPWGPPTGSPPAACPRTSSHCGWSTFRPGTAAGPATSAGP